MRRWLVALYPASWRRRYAAEYLDLLGEFPLSVALVGDVLRGAGRERARIMAGWAPAAKSAMLVSVGLVLTFLFWACWHDIYAEADATTEWRGATVTAVLLGLVGVLWGRRRARAATALGAVMIGASALALGWQYGLGGLPTWSATVAPLQVAMTAYAVAWGGAVAFFVRDVRRELREAQPGPATSAHSPSGPTNQR